jgi:hypothetical protein
MADRSFEKSVEGECGCGIRVRVIHVGIVDIRGKRLVDILITEYSGSTFHHAKVSIQCICTPKDSSSTLDVYEAES